MTGLSLGLGLLLVLTLWLRWAVLTGPAPAAVAMTRLLHHGPTTVDDFQYYPFRALHRSTAPRPFADRRSTLLSNATIETNGAKPLHWLTFATGHDTRALLVIHDNPIVYEHYADGFTPQSKSQLFSVSKSLTSLLVGMAIDDGRIAGVDASITAQVPELRACGFDVVNWARLLSMRSGLHYRENDNPFGRHVILNYTSNIEQMVLGFNLDAARRNLFEYKSGDTALAALALARAVAPESITAYTQRRLWSPLGMEDDAVWTVDRDGGLEKAWCCLAGTARDLAKVGRLLLSGGEVDGKKVISPAWIARSTSTDMVGEGLRPSDRENVGIGGYGYGWWLATAVDGDYFAQGKDGQFLYINPAYKTIIVRLGRSAGGLPPSRWITLFRHLARDAATSATRAGR